MTLRYLTWYGGDRLPTTTAWIKAFNEEWPRVKVEVEEAPLAEIPTKFQTQLAGGTAPDVLLADSHAQTKWFDSGAHLDLTSYLARDRINLDRDYALVGIEHWCGKVYFVPFFADSNAIFYNKTLLDQAGLKDPWADGKGDWTLDDLATMARTVTRDLNGDGQPDQWGSPPRSESPRRRRSPGPAGATWPTWPRCATRWTAPSPSRGTASSTTGCSKTASSPPRRRRSG